MSSPYINRFLQPDTIIPSPASPQSWNRYSYVLNNPINAYDPTGHKCAGETEECSDENGKPINGAGGLTPKPKKDKDSPEDILKKYSNKQWHQLTLQEQEILLAYQCGPSCWAENQSGSANDAEFWMDPLFYGELFVGGRGVIRAGVTLWEMASATLPVLTAAGADGDPTNEAKIVYDIAQKIAENTAGILGSAKGNGYSVTLPGAYSGKDIVARMMVDGGMRLEPYYRVAVDKLGAVTSNGAFSSNQEATHHLINLANPAQTIAEITSLIQGLIK